MSRTATKGVNRGEQEEEKTVILIFFLSLSTQVDGEEGEGGRRMGRAVYIIEGTPSSSAQQAQHEQVGWGPLESWPGERNGGEPLKLRSHSSLQDTSK